MNESCGSCGGCGEKRLKTYKEMKINSEDVEL